MSRNVLVAFDFDHTICDDNTDLVVQKLLKEERITKDVQNLRKSNGWIVYMDRIFELLHESSVNAGQIEDAIFGIPAVAGMEKLLASLHANGHEVIVISDSNSVFINHWLRSRRLEHVVSRVFTNPARYDDDGRLRVDAYHTQHTCQISSINLCKGQILMDYVQEKRAQGRSYERIVYVGDGGNDLCPILRLSEADLACPRKDYSLIERLNKLPISVSTKAKIVPWQDGTDLQRSLEQIIELKLTN
ncbi:pyridoxal phosphate phosphatase PHOSPHO2 isoform X2 [Solenopsis invicta]|nr:pyridoxal phosphate phosphatase PHOSPHO2 isoform X2 [Solenopsis invicta]XP_011155571.1 pyridoxal phosphate phosphatase PHOSPHO2 isoform X2 [Solenopsis invicta]XP_011155572.1 pyridoxal phosphate phosphatase PHOSPHO2 isoform X2 [Solenopsis invicta]XP_011155573.1 pyridoxal phosphate phosphatase PHOSPHO2 isoform X2 [Solenopsis invicta]XP_011155575.1 pyridoxal phosphate phosphatase PHOSPHO2 isoform X2 [Solenopsis invicta]XP_025993024.1 pyridoxal phosphate phosphatase PHOSPHO2 isoform X2 [Solenop